MGCEGMKPTFYQHFRPIIEEIEEQLQKEKAVLGNSKRMASLIVKLEVIVWVLRQVYPNENQIKALSYLLYSPIFPSALSLSNTTRRYIKNLQLLFNTSWRMQRVVEDAALSYQQVKTTFPLHLRFDGEIFTWRKLAFGSREKQYRERLEQELPFQIASPNYPKAGDTLEFYSNQIPQRIVLPKTFITSNDHTRQSLQSKQHEMLTVTYEELIKSAREMDEIRRSQGLKTQNWEKRILDLQLLDAKRNLSEISILELIGTKHLIGPLSAGKSTLMQIMAFHFSQQNKISTLVVKDISEALSLVDEFYQLGITAVPLISPNQRNNHIQQYLSSRSTEEKKQLGLEIFQSRSFRYLSKNCPVQHLTKSNDINLVQEQPPCTKLKIVCDAENNSKNEHVICPYFSQCGYHKNFHDLSYATVVVTTIQSLISTKMPAALFEQDMTALTYVITQTDLILVDEADRVQHTLDQICMPSELIGGNEESWLIKLEQEIRHHLAKREFLSGKPAVINWMNNLSFAIACERRIRVLFADERTKRVAEQLVGNRSFTGRNLLHIVAERLTQFENKGSPTSNEKKRLQRIWKEFSLFYNVYRTSKRKGNASPLENMANLIIDEENGSHQEIENYLSHIEKREGITYKEKDNLIIAFSLALLFCHLEKRLFVLTHTYENVQDKLELTGMQNTTLFRRLPSEYDGLLPISPVGMQFGFKYRKDEQRGIGTFQLFRYLGVGRYLLLYMSELFQYSHEYNGAATLLLSGTSHAEGSYRYNIQLPVSYVLRNKGIHHSTLKFIYRPLPDPLGGGWIKISGAESKDKRKRKLRHAIQALRSNGYLSKLLATLPENRQRIMIIVGSYSDAQCVTEALCSFQLYREDEVFCLSNNNSDLEEELNTEYLYERQRLKQFASGNGKILVAPLLAVERGHNILNHEGKAAFGAAIYLVRPYPVPDDLVSLANRTNAFAMDGYRDTWFKKDSLVDEFHALRRVTYDVQSTFFKYGFGYKYLADDERVNLLMETNTVCHQLEGRLIRGGADAKIIFCDASFSPGKADGLSETEKTSMLEGWKKILHQLCEQKTDSIEAKISQLLYGARLQALEQLEVE